MNLDAFYENQLTAINHQQKPMLVVAGPGSGKTTVIVHRVKRLLETGVSAEKILVITFTKAAATEMKDRFLALMDINRSPLTFATFHSLFFRILRSAYSLNTSQIITEEEKWRMLRMWMIELDIESNDREETIRNFLSAVSLFKSELVSLDNFEAEGITKPDFLKLYKQYEGYKERSEQLDFDDMITRCYELLVNDEEVLSMWQKRFQYILIDEFQDANRAQYETIKLLAKPLNNLFIVGDDDQSIYAFRGARPDLLLSFTKDYPEAIKVTLNRNFRSTDKIVRLSEKIIGNNGKRLPKNMVSAKEEGRKTILLSAQNSVEEGKKIVAKICKLHEKGIGYTDIAIICRTNIQGGLYAGLLGNSGVPYILKDKGINPWSHWITQDILAYISLSQNKEDNQAARRILNKPKRYISKAILQEAGAFPYSLLESLPLCASLKLYQKKALQELQGHLGEIRRRKPQQAIEYIRKTIAYDDYLQEYANFTRANLHGYLEIADEATEIAKGMASILEYQEKIKELDEELTARSNEKVQPTEGVTISTMHSAKGLEFYAVFIPSIIEGVLPHEKSMTASSLEEERRLFYVAVTRAKELLYLSEIKTRHDKEAKRSRFLKELGIH